jgi:hypothetical protein
MISVRWIAALCLAAGGAAAQDAITPKDTIHLFNGKDLTNFYTWLSDAAYQDPDKVFGVVEDIDGGPAIRISGQHWGGLFTTSAYTNYRLLVEFRWGLLTWGPRKGRARDSGVLVHGTGRDGSTQANFRGPWMQSIECQVAEGVVGDFIAVRGFEENGQTVTPKLTVRAKKIGREFFYDPAAEPTQVQRANWSGHAVDWKDELGFRGPNDVESPWGQWTRLEVVCEGDSVTLIVNGKTVNVATKSSLSKGKILLQSEGAEVFYRKVDLEPLTR